MIIIDDREMRAGIAKKLYEKGVKYEVKRLEIGDYVLSRRLCIERKDAADLEGSICDGRIFQQASDMATNYDRPVVAVLGNNFFRLNPKSVKGTVRSLATRFRIPVLFFDDEDDFVNYLILAEMKENLENQGAPRIDVQKKAETPEEQRLRIIAAFPGVGPTHARALLKHFGSIVAIVKATETELREVKGIGEEKAKKIVEVSGPDWPQGK